MQKKKKKMEKEKEKEKKKDGRRKKGEGEKERKRVFREKSLECVKVGGAMGLGVKQLKKEREKYYLNKKWCIIVNLTWVFLQNGYIKYKK